MNDAMPAIVSPSPTWTTDSPTTCVKNTADPAMNVPSPRAKRSDWVANLPARGEGGMACFLRVDTMLIATHCGPLVRHPSCEYPTGRSARAWSVEDGIPAPSRVRYSPAQKDGRHDARTTLRPRRHHRRRPRGGHRLLRRARPRGRGTDVRRGR